MKHVPGVWLLGSILITAPATLAAEQTTAPTVTAIPDQSRPTLLAVRVADAPAIDGHLADEAWSHAPAADHFRQRDPNEGRPATERTEIRVVYDDNARGPRSLAPLRRTCRRCVSREDDVLDRPIASLSRVVRVPRCYAVPPNVHANSP